MGGERPDQEEGNAHDEHAGHYPVAGQARAGGDVADLLIYYDELYFGQGMAAGKD